VELAEPSGGPGHRFVFSNDLVLERIDGRTPGHGLPQPPEQRRAGTHSGFVTTLRADVPNDSYFPSGVHLWQYEGTYKLDAVPTTVGQGLSAGQIVARGVLVLDSDNNFQPAEPVRFAIVGGTEDYATARGQITETDDERLLDIQL
jgi:hypothetical protein